jgi:hypothetical protein
MFADMGQGRGSGLALGAAVMAVAIAGCGGDKDDDAAAPAAKQATTTPAAPAAVAAPPADDAIARAVSVVNAQKGGIAVSMRGKIGANGQNTTVKGQGKIDRAKGLGAFTVTSNVGASDLAVREVLSDGRLYLTSKIFTNRLPGKRSWMRIDLDKLKDTQGFDQTALGTNGPSQDPSQVLDYLRGAGPAKRLGTETIRGTQTTHYSADVDLQRALKQTKGAAAKASIQSLVNLLGEKATVPVEVWLDGDHRVLRERVSYKATLQGVANSLDFTTDFTAFGVPVSVDTPPSSDTVDGLEILSQAQQQQQQQG